MKKQKIIHVMSCFVLFLLIVINPSRLEGRRKTIVPRFQSVQLQAQNEPNQQDESSAEPAISEPTTDQVSETTPPSTTSDMVEVVEIPAPQQVEASPIKPIGDKKDDRKDIFLNFENADLKTFANYIGELKNLNVIPDPKIAGNKISLTIRDPLTVEGAWNIFTTVLEMSDYAIVKVGQIYKIISSKQKLTEPLPTYINVPSADLPDNDLTVRYVTFLTNIPINQVQSLLESMLSTGGKITPYPNANGFVITDKSYNIKSAMKVIQELDKSDTKQSVTVMRLKRANAGDVAKLFESLMQKPQGHPLARLFGKTVEKSVEYFPPTTKIIEEPRTNSLILLGDAKSIKKIEEFVTNYVDTELKGVKSPIHIYELQNTDVDQIKDILETITTSQADSPAAKHGGIRGGVKYFQKMKFSMDKANNRLLVSSSDTQDWKLLKKTIFDLDKPQPQVALETLIVSVDFNKEKQLGGQIRSKKYSNLAHNVNYQAAHEGPVVFEKSGTSNVSLLGDLMQNMVANIGSTVLSFGAKGDTWSILKLLQSQTNTTVLSRPFIITTNMKQATIEVGETRRVVSQEALAEQTGNVGNAAGYENAEASYKINVTPQINLDGVITLKINASLIEFLDSTGTSPNTTEKKLDTKVSVADGQVLVLGGFVKTKVAETMYETPILSKIPVLGWLFKYKDRQVTKQYIFIFIAPTIIKPRTLPGSDLYTKMKIYEAKDDIDDAIEVKRTIDPIHNWFFNSDGETYSHKVTDFANARYQPTSVDIIEDPYYRAKTLRQEQAEEALEEKAETAGAPAASVEELITPKTTEPSGTSQPEAEAPAPEEAQPVEATPEVIPQPTEEAAPEQTTQEAVTPPSIEEPTPEAPVVEPVTPDIQKEAKLVYEKPAPKKLTQNVAANDNVELGEEFMEEFEENLEDFDFDKDPTPSKEVKKINSQNFSNEELRNMRRSRLKDLLASQYTKPAIQAKRRENIKELFDGENAQ